MADDPSTPALEFHPVTPDRWGDLERLFGERGACAGCWCMWWRLKRSEWSRGRGEGNRLALKAIVEAGETPGILAYSGATPVGWCAVAPRESFSALQRSRTIKPIDDQPVWSVVCFFIARPFRRKGLTLALLRAAAEHVRARGGRILEGYPSRPDRATADAWLYRGIATAFERAGFVEVARPSASVSIMRYTVV